VGGRGRKWTASSRGQEAIIIDEKLNSYSGNTLNQFSVCVDEVSWYWGFHDALCLRWLPDLTHIQDGGTVERVCGCADVRAEICTHGVRIVSCIAGYGLVFYVTVMGWDTTVHDNIMGPLRESRWP